MSTLSQQMDNAMLLRGFADKTREAHLATVRDLATYFHRLPR